MWNQSSTCSASDLLLDGSQTGIPIGKNCDRRGFGDSALAHGKIDRAHRLGTSVANEGKTGGMPIAIQRLPCNHFEVSFRPLVSISDVPTIQPHDQFFTLPVRRTGSERFCRLLQPSAHLHRPVAHRAGSGLCGQRQKLAQEISDLSKRQQRSHLGREIPQLGRDRTLVCEQCGEAVRVPSRARASSYSLDAGHMPLNLRCYNFLLQACKQRFAFGYRQSHTVAGESSSDRSIMPTSRSTTLPGTTSTTSLIVHFIPRD